MIRVLEEGEPAAASRMARLGSVAVNVRELAYRLSHVQAKELCSRGT